MRINRNKKGFTLIELIVVIAILGVLVLMAGPRLLGYTQKAELTRIQHDTKVMEQEMDQILIKDETKIYEWDNNGKELGILVMQEKLFEKEGLAKNVDRNNNSKGKRSLSLSNNDELGVGGEHYNVNEQLTSYNLAADGDAESLSGDGYKIVPDDYKGKIKTKLKGTFYTNETGKVYYENDKPLKADKDIGILCESPEALPDYEFNFETGTIVKWNGNEEHLVIPHSFNNPVNNECTTVRAIGPGAFMRDELQSVVIPDTVTIIGENAFKDNNLIEINIPHSVVEVGNGAFDNNYIQAGSGNYENNNTNFVGGNDFEQNGISGNVTITPGYKAPSASDVGVVFKPSTGTIVSGGVGNISSNGGTGNSVSSPDEITIPNEINVGGVNYPIKEIAKGSYQGLGLKSVTLPSGLERIEDYAFAGNQLRGITIPEKVSYIGNYAFAFNEETRSKEKSATIKTIKIKNGSMLEEQISKLDESGDIYVGGKKTPKIGIAELKKFIFVTNIDKHVIDEEYVGSNVPTDNAGDSNANGIYSDDEIEELVKKEGYVKVSTAEELDAVRNNLSGQYIQTKDIDLSGYSAADGKGWEPIGDHVESNQFKGVYDGGGFKVSNMKINRPKSDHIGLFAYFRKARVINIGLENVEIKGNSNVGGLVGLSSLGSVVDNVYVSGDVVGTTNYTGGIIGYQNGSSILNSYSNVKVAGASITGGLLGLGIDGEIENSYSSGFVVVGSYAGGLVGLGSPKFTNSYYDKEASGQVKSAGGVGKSTSEMKMQSTYSGWGFNTIWQIEEGQYPTLKWQK